MKRNIFSGDVVQFVTHREHQEACDWVGQQAKVNLWLVWYFDPESDVFTLQQGNRTYVVTAVEDELVKVADYDDLMASVGGESLSWGDAVG